MSTRHRSARPSATPAGSRVQSAPASTQVEPPRYVVPSAPLNDRAISELERLSSHSQYTKKIQEAQAKALGHLTESTVAANEATQRQQAELTKFQTRLRRLQTEAASQTQSNGTPLSGSVENGNDAGADWAEKIRRAREQVREQESYAQEVKKRAETMTGKAEEKVRAVIDQRVQVEARDKVLKEVSGNVVRGEGRVAPTQSTLGASQFRTQPNLDGDDDDEMAGTQARQANSALNSMHRKVEEEDEKYQTKTMRARYAQDRDYDNFKKSVHDAIHHDDGVRVPHYTQWFPSEPGDDLQVQAHDTPNYDEDSDVEVAREVISTKCPITLLELKEVLTSPCDHNFEAASIKEMISMSMEYAPVAGSTQTQRRGRGQKIIRCPVPSCQCKFTMEDLRIDRLMRRKIARIQEQNQREEEGEYDDGFDDSRTRAVSVTDGVSRLSDRRRQGTVPVKPEPRSSMAPRGHSAIVHAPGPSVTGMDDDEDDEMDDDFEDGDEY